MAIAEWLTAEGVRPSSGVWWPRTIATMIRCPTYMGHRCQQDPKTLKYGKVLHRCEPLVDAATWKRANEALATRPTRGRTGPAKQAMLAGAVYCPRCEDSPMYLITCGRDKLNNPYLYYRCYGRGRARRGCGNLVRMELAHAAVSKIIAADFDVPVMEHRIVNGNEAAIEARLEEIRFEIGKLGSADLADEDYDRRLSELRAERDRVKATPVVADRVELTPTGESYAELWARTPVAERGPWLARHGFRVTASKTEVTVAQGGTSATVSL